MDVLNNNSDHDSKLDCQDPMFSHSVDLALSVLYVLLAIVGTVGNIMVCMTVFITPNLRTTWNYLLVNLSIADAIGTGLYFPLAATDLIMSYRGICREEAQDTVSDIVVNVSFSASLLTITLVGIERAVVIVWPLKRSRVMTATVFRVSLAGIWFVAIVFGVGGDLFLPHFTSYLSIPMYVVMLACYTVIFVVIKRRKSHITCHTRRNAVERRVVQTIVIVTVVFTLFWTPMFGFLFSGLMENWEDIAFPVAASSAAINPVIYCYKNTEYRKAFKRIILCQCNDTIFRSRRISSASSAGFHWQKGTGPGQSISVILCQCNDTVYRSRTISSGTSGFHCKKRTGPGQSISVISLPRKRSETNENNS